MKWIYVQAYEGNHDDELAFRHTTVSAASEEDAYLEGQRHFEQQPEWPPKRIANDYVIALAD